MSNLDNGRSLEGRVDDRGPVCQGMDYGSILYRCQRVGVAPVKIEAMGGKSASSYDFKRGNFTVQVGAFQQKLNPQRLANRMKDSHITLYDSPRGRFYRVRVGRYSNLAKAVKARRKLENEDSTMPLW